MTQDYMRQMTSLTKLREGAKRGENPEQMELRGIPLIGGTISKSFKEVEDETQQRMEKLKSSKMERIKNWFKGVFNLNAKN